VHDRGCLDRARAHTVRLSRHRRRKLNHIARCWTAPVGQLRRAKILLLVGELAANQAIACQVGCDVAGDCLALARTRTLRRRPAEPMGGVEERHAAYRDWSCATLTVAWQVAVFPPASVPW
jgi:hypothetical protein